MTTSPLPRSPPRSSRGQERGGPCGLWWERGRCLPSARKPGASFDWSYVTNGGQGQGLAYLQPKSPHGTQKRLAWRSRKGHAGPWVSLDLLSKTHGPSSRETASILNHSAGPPFAVCLGLACLSQRLGSPWWKSRLPWKMKCCLVRAEGCSEQRLLVVLPGVHLQTHVWGWRRSSGRLSLFSCDFHLSVPEGFFKIPQSSCLRAVPASGGKRRDGRAARKSGPPKQRPRSPDTAIRTAAAAGAPHAAAELEAKGRNS